MSSFFAANLLKIAEGGWLPLDLRRHRVRRHDHVALRHRCHARGACQQTPEAGERLLVGPRIRRHSARRGHDGVPDPEQPEGLAAHHGSRAFRPACCRAEQIALNIVFESTPRVAGPKMPGRRERGGGRVAPRAHFGFFEIPDLKSALERVSCGGLGGGFRAARYSWRPAISWCASRALRTAGAARGAVRISVPQFRKGRGPVQSAARPGDGDRATDRDLAARAGRRQRVAGSTRAAHLSESDARRAGSAHQARSITVVAVLQERALLARAKAHWMPAPGSSVPAGSRPHRGAGPTGCRCRADRPPADCSR